MTKYAFSKKSLSRLESCAPDLQVLFNTVIQYVDCTIIEGHRSQERQNDLYHEGKSKLEWPNSKHNTIPSEGVDVSIYPIDWNDTKRNYFFGGLVLGIAHILKESGMITRRVRWGGDWDSDNDLNDQTFNDLVHFELV